MKKNLLIAAIAITALASCSSNDFVGDESPQGSIETVGAIGFNLNVPTPTRGTSGDATKLNNLFIVWGEKNETSNAAPSTGNLVFPNYKVTYGTNTAYTTTSNTKDWEYVGLKWSAADAANVKIANTAATENDQTIKYWDYAANNYVFTAVSANPEDITKGRVVINKLTSGTSTVYDKGYQITLAKDESNNYPSLTDLYFSDRNVIAKGTGTDRTADNAYGGNVTFTFRNSLSHVRAGVYETIPGYEVSEIKFYKDDGTTEYDNGPGTPVSAFGAVCHNVSANNFEGSIAVTYYDATKAEIQNHPKLSVAPSSGVGNDDLVLGTNFSTLTVGSTEPAVAAKFLGTTASAPTYDTDGGSYTAVLSQIDNSTPLKLKVNYKLYNTVTKEIIQVTGKTAVIPAEYLQWKANYKYTYLFKITDDNLYPITFDACYLEDENGNQETITTVSEPSITTYAKGSAVTVNGEYKAGEKVYAVVEDGSNLATLSASNMKLYTVTTTDDSNFPITEASVAEAIAEYPTLNAAEQSAAKIKFTASSFNYSKTIVAEDGATVEMDATNNVVADFTGAAITSPSAAPQYYAIEYIKSAATYGNDGGKTYADATAFNAAGTLYTDAACTTAATSWTDGTTYYKKTHVTAVGTYAYKIVKVVP